ncbi:MAG: DUF58 domain-containing protein [Spirochaetes bacterium]|nr:DUF58 domain-containing protein [Spirochaetota bacterium]
MRNLISIIRNIYLEHNFFIAAFALPAMAFAVFYFENLLSVFIICVSLFLGITVFELFFVLISSKKISARRILASRLSNGDDNRVTVEIRSDSKHSLVLRCIDELPYQLQVRDWYFDTRVKPNSVEAWDYKIHPRKRGLYAFGSLHIYVKSFFRFISYRVSFETDQKVKVYPSIIALKEYDFYACSHKLPEPGLKRIRRSAVTHEFDALRNYRYGDEFRSVNWKATARKGHLIVNNYVEDRSQQIYMVLDTGRSMQMPFEKMSLVDHAVNSALILSNVAIRRQDKAGLITLSPTECSIVKADNRSNQLYTILENLYKTESSNYEVNYELLYKTVNNYIHHRSLLILYTNFETVHAMKRVLPILKLLSKRHLLLCVIFRNPILEKKIFIQAKTISDIYLSAAASDITDNKKIIYKELLQNGIQSIYVNHRSLTVQLINKYLELKAGGVL